MLRVRIRTIPVPQTALTLLKDECCSANSRHPESSGPVSAFNGHKFAAKLSARTSRMPHGRPTCNESNRVDLHEHSEVLAVLDQASKNPDFNPAGVWLCCEICQHRSEAPLHWRTLHGRGCSYCANRRLSANNALSNFPESAQIPETVSTSSTKKLVAVRHGRTRMRATGTVVHLASKLMSELPKRTEATKATSARCFCF